MATIKYKPTTPSRRNMTTTGFNRNQFFLRAEPSIA